MNLLNDMLKEYVYKQLDQPESPIWHYTKQESYANIFRCFYLKFNSHHVLNKKNPANAELKEVSNLIIKNIKESKKLREENYEKRFNDFMKDGVVVYTISFSNICSKFLFEKYGEYCLKFNYGLFENYLNENDNTMFGNVIYNTNQKKTIIHEMFEIYEKYEKTSSQPEVDLFLWLAIIMPFFKKNDDSNDKECRLTQVEIFDNYQQDDGKRLTTLVPKKISFNKKDVEIILQKNIREP